MTLLQEIQQAAVSSEVPLPDLLRRCKILATRLEVTSCAVESWDKPVIAAADGSVPDLATAEQLGLDPLVQVLQAHRDAHETEDRRRRQATVRRLGSPA